MYNFRKEYPGIMSIKYKRVLLKLSGEAISGKENGIIDFDLLAGIASVIKKCADEGTQVAVMIGAGNIWRGRQGGTMNRSRADHMGMLATTINSLALQQALEDVKVKAVPKPWYKFQLPILQKGAHRRFWL